MRLHIVTNNTAGSQYSQYRLAWVDLKAEVTIMLSTGTRRAQRQQKWCGDL